MEAKTEKLDIRMPTYLLDEIEKYQNKENISNRTTAMLELIRIGLNTVNEYDVKVQRGDSQRIDIRVPVGLLDKIEKYKEDKKNIKTRAAAMKVLVLIGIEITSN